METALIISQTVFYSVVSAAIIVVATLMGVAAYSVIRAARQLQAIAKSFHDASSEALERIEEMFEKLSALPILSFFLKLRRKAAKNNNKK